ncbi:plasmid mobilization relaxosome protein MobC [Alistipes sp. OttesenSCG-928-L06]|nr:plasmid mobilization relaxosome protein MobC [Alistipes sp. OttesenSCG-928-L06]
MKLNMEEEYSLRRRCKQASLSKQEYIRQSIANSMVVQRISPEISDMIRKLCGMANNLNQIAKKANQVGYSDIRTEYLLLAESIDNLIQRIRHDRENIDRE